MWFWRQIPGWRIVVLFCMGSFALGHPASRDRPNGNSICGSTTNMPHSVYLWFNWCHHPRGSRGAPLACHPIPKFPDPSTHGYGLQTPVKISRPRPREGLGPRLQANDVQLLLFGASWLGEILQFGGPSVHLIQRFTHKTTVQPLYLLLEFQERVAVSRSAACYSGIV